MSVRIAYYYSVDRAGRPVSAQENASRRSGKVAQCGHARRYGQTYTGCLMIKMEETLIYCGVDEIYLHDQFLTKISQLSSSTKIIQLSMRSPVKRLRYISFAQLVEQIYVSYARGTLYARRAAARVRSLPLRVHSFFRLHLRASHRRAFPLFVE